MKAQTREFSIQTAENAVKLTLMKARVVERTKGQSGDRK